MSYIAEPNPQQVDTGGSDACQDAEPISGTGVFAFNNVSATQDGPAHAACNLFNQNQIDHDVWFCWTAPPQACSGSYSISTCGRTSVDTRIAVYNGCACPPNDGNLLNCRDDECDTQTRLSFSATPGQQYLIRLGTFPGESGGTGTFAITCQAGAPCNEPASHCQQQDQSDALNSNQAGFIVADGFTPTQSGNMNGICWWGAYLNNNNQDCEASTTDNFRIRYFTNANGLPGTVIATFSQQAGTLTVEPPYSTGLLINSVALEYEFHATHANLPVVAGTCYWVEISNTLTGCTWFWELGLSGDGRAAQDGRDGQGIDGYTPSDVLVADLAFCTNLTIEHGGIACLPPSPANDNCANATAISGPGTFTVDTASATTDGPANVACQSSGQSQITRDAWFNWTSTCAGDVVVRTCNTTTVDTRIAAYAGTACPTAATAPLACNDDLCGPGGLQSMVVFGASPNQQFLIRVGSYPQSAGGVIGMVITCGGPDNASCGSGSPNTSCCSASPTDSGGCADEACCELVCTCDPFCCNTEWDSSCAQHGFGGSGCGAGDLCECQSICGNPNAGDCCAAHGPGQVGCNDQACCQAVCACDPFCCDTQWDDNCAGNGFVPGCGAAVLCANCGATCTEGSSCPDDGLACTQDICLNGSCQHPPSVIGSLCGNQVSQGPCDQPDICDGAGSCSPNYAPASVLCRAAVNECDLPESCNGASAGCPTDHFVDDGSACTSDSDECTADECQQGQCTHPALTDGPCATIPTVSAWGFTCLILSLLAGAKIIFSRNAVAG